MGGSAFAGVFEHGFASVGQSGGLNKGCGVQKFVYFILFVLFF